VQNLEGALAKANEEVAELRRQVLQIETQATKLFQLNSSQGKGKHFYHPIVRRSLTR
jgi:hypothetical protein